MRKDKKTKDELKPDTVLKDYWKQKDAFADFFNAFLFGGREVLRADELEERDTDSSTVLEVEDADISIQAARDMLNIVMRCHNVQYAILGLENQDHIHYALPFKTGGYDIYSYDRQYKQKKAYYRKTKELTGNEKMSGIKKTDRFLPVVTVVIYYGSEPWDGPTCLHDMLDIPGELKPFVPDYKVNLVEARDNNLIFHNQNNQDLFSLLKIIYNDSEDRKIRREKIRRYEEQRTIDKSVRMAIAATSGVDLNKYEKEEATVCRLWDEVRADGVEDGRIDGRIEGKIEGKIEGRIEGKAEAIIDILEDVGNVSEELKEFIYSQKDLNELKKMLKLASSSKSVDEFEEKAGILSGSKK